MSILEKLSRVEIENNDTAFVVIQSTNSELLLVATPEDSGRISLLMRALYPNFTPDIKMIQYLVNVIKLTTDCLGHEKYFGLSTLTSFIVYTLRMAFPQFHHNHHYCRIFMAGDTVATIQLYDRQNGTMTTLYELTVDIAAHYKIPVRKTVETSNDD